MNNENDILEFLNKNGLRYLSKFETTEAKFKSFLKKKIDVFEPNLSTSKKNEFIHLITEKMKKLNYVNDLRYSEIKGEKILKLYQYYTKVAKHYFCSICGIHTHNRPRINPKIYGINIACIDDIDTFALKDVPVNNGENHPLDQKK